MGGVTEMGLWSPFSELGEIGFQFSANNEPTMAVLIAMKCSKVEMMEVDLPMIEPNQPIQVQRKRQTSGCLSASPWALISPSIAEIS